MHMRVPNRHLLRSYFLLTLISFILLGQGCFQVKDISLSLAPSDQLTFHLLYNALQKLVLCL